MSVTGGTGGSAAGGTGGAVRRRAARAGRGQGGSQGGGRARRHGRHRRFGRHRRCGQRARHVRLGRVLEDRHVDRIHRQRDRHRERRQRLPDVGGLRRRVQRKGLELPDLAADEGPGHRSSSSARTDATSPGDGSRSAPATTRWIAYSLNETANDTAMTNFSIARDKMRLIPYIKAAQAVKSNIRFWASPWSPPTWMKTGPYNPNTGASHSNFDGGVMKSDDATLEGVRALPREVRPGVRRRGHQRRGRLAAERAQLPAELPVLPLGHRDVRQLRRQVPGPGVDQREPRHQGHGRHAVQSRAATPRSGSRCCKTRPRRDT